MFVLMERYQRYGLYRRDVHTTTSLLLKFYAMTRLLSSTLVDVDVGICQCKTKPVAASLAMCTTQPSIVTLVALATPNASLVSNSASGTYE